MAARKLLVICVRNEGYAASLERRKVYEAISDPEAAAMGQVRVVDESGEDYLYPASFFRPVDLAPAVRRAAFAAA